MVEGIPWGYEVGEDSGQETGFWPTPSVFVAEKPPRFTASEDVTSVSLISGKFSSALWTRGLGRASRRQAAKTGEPGAVPGQERGCRGAGVPSAAAGLPTAEGAAAEEGMRGDRASRPPLPASRSRGVG